METIRNVEQAEQWNGEEGEHWAAHHAEFDTMLDPYNVPLMKAAAVSATDKVLDIGCGNGSTTRAAARAALDGSALGVDLSGPQLAQARALAEAEGLVNVSFEQGDAEVHPFEAGAFDLAISRFGIMFFGDPEAAFSNIRRALRPGGRVAFMCWRDLFSNEWAMVPGAALATHLGMPDFGGGEGGAGPFAFAEAQRFLDVLGRAGFTDATAEAVDVQQRLGKDANDAVEFVRGLGMVKMFPNHDDDELVERALAALRDTLAEREGPDGVFLQGATWLVTATAP